MDNSPIQQIKDRLDIVEIAGSYIKLTKTGINWRSSCPFHADKTPSFFVSPARQSFKCFGCGAGGSIFDFIMKIEGVEFGDALRILARKAGIELKSFNPQLTTQRQRLYEICEMSCRFFEKQLEASSMGKQVKDYLLKRGLQQETIKKWRLGYAPEMWQGLSDFLVGRGYKREEIVEAGLAIKSETSQTPYDRFRGRIIFPVFDLNSQVIGFGGRITEQESQKIKEKGEVVAKYINTSNTLLYDKGKVLYGLNFAKSEIRQKDFCILTEGYTDVILSHQAGFLNTVAASGTALTSFQLKILKRYTSLIFSAFDMDMAGDFATKRGIDLAQQEGFEVRVISMSQGADPADILSKDPAQWEKAIKEAQEIMNFYFNSALSKFDKENPQGKKEIANFLLPAIKKIPNQILRSHWVQKLALILRVPEEAVIEEIKKISYKESSGPFQQRNFNNSGGAGDSISLKQNIPKLRNELLEERIISLLLKYPNCAGIIDENGFVCLSEKTRTILAVFKSERVEDEQTLQKALSALKEKNQEFEALFENYFFETDLQNYDDPEQEIQICFNFLQHLHTQKKMQEITMEIKLAEETKDENKLNDLMQKFNEIAVAYAKTKI